MSRVGGGQSSKIGVISAVLPTGASTLAEQQAQTALLTTIEANQLPNDHDVNVTNMIPAVETGLATSTIQTDGTQVTKLKETVPTDALKNNGSGVLAYDGNGDLSTITKTIGGTSYVKTLTYTARVLTGISAWSVV